ncbi:MAG: hypothetical protein SynsKO_24660 [Synoicihabitans sp.]
MEEAQNRSDLTGVLYFSNSRKEPLEYAIVSYTKDGGTVFGLSTHWDSPQEAANMLTEMRSYFGVSGGYSFTEDFPRDSEAEFCKRETEFNNLNG